MIIYTVLLGEDKNKSPEIADEPRIYTVIAFVGCHQDLWHHWQQAFQGELLKVRQQLVLVNVEDLKTPKRWVLLDHGVTDVHSFVVGVADARLDVRKIQRVLPV